ncbi:MAG: universal stress protein [Candidatus Obscuribacterales bacterium]|nr:universal stress protein [Candidatus Obscuribacterales bacterium]
MKIIAALDGSQHSSATLNFLLSYHWPAGSWIKLVHVLPCERGLMQYVMHAFGKENECDTENVSLILAGVAEELARSLHNVSVSAEVLAGDPVDSILSFADTFHPDLLVTGCRKKTAVDSILLGSVSQKLLEGMNCPVAIVRGDSARLDPDRGANVLVAVDDSEHSAAAVEWLQWQEWMKQSHIALLSVTEPLHQSAMDGIRSASDHLLTYQAEKMLIESLLTKWGIFLQQGANAREITRGTVDGSPAETILTGARNWPANLIVMGAHGRTGIAKIMLGSVSQHISTHAHCSVLIVKGMQSKLYDLERTQILDSMVLDDLAAEQTKPGPSGIPASNWTGSSGHVPPTGLF